jgi:hypothetical protein
MVRGRRMIRDMIGVACLFGGLYLMLMIGMGAGL